MPVRLEAQGFAAYVQVNGKAIECHGTSRDTREDMRSEEVSCWIASKENETFSVNFSKAAKNLTCVAYLAFDGHTIIKQVMKGSDTSTKWCRKIVEGYKRPFTFSSQIVGDDNALLDNVNIASQSSIGEIQIRVKRISGLTPIRVPYSKNDYPLLPIQTIHETRVKTSKALHQIALGNATSKIVRGKLKDTYKYTVHETLATFTFRYRPLDTLVDSGIAPPTGKVLAPAALSLQSRHARGSPVYLQRNTPTYAYACSLPPPVASSSRLQRIIKPTAETKSSSKHQAATTVVHANTEGHPSGLSFSGLAQTLSSNDILATASESKPHIKHLKDDTDDVGILEDEEQSLLTRLELVRDCKRKALAESREAAPKKMLKREPSLPRSFFTPGEVIDLT